MKRTRFLAGSTTLFAGSAIPALPNTTGQTSAQQPDGIDQYRKLDEFLSFLRTRNAKQYAITSPDGVDEARYVAIGGIDQWITIRGWDRANPVLLFLHGGPGDPTNPWSFMFFAPWEKQFTIVQWDQRGAGRTLQKSGPGIAPTIILDRMVRDGIELSEYLCTYLRKRSIVILGHSFGSVLGVLMARARPERFAAYVGTGQVGNASRNYFVAYDALVVKARALGNKQALDELESVGPPPYASGAGYRVQWKWSTIFEGADKFLAGNIGRTLVAPRGSAQDVVNDADGMVGSADRLVPQTQSLGPEELGLVFHIPIFFIQGAEDFTTATSLAKEYFDALAAPRKAFVTIPNGGHFAVFIHSDQFLAKLTPLIKPGVAGSKNDSPKVRSSNGFT
jgi:pimeloyl-ACP methyl ester carboxylesterase